MSGYTRAPRCSRGMRSDQSPRLPPTIDGDADMSIPYRRVNGCGLKRDVQSMTFLSRPGIEALYSGDTRMKPSLPSRRSFSRTAPSGMCPSCSSSPSYEGQSKSDMDARSAVPPNDSTTCPASVASRSFSELLRRDAPNTSTFTANLSVIDLSPVGLQSQNIGYFVSRLVSGSTGS